MTARETYANLYTTLTAAGYTAGDPSAEIAADARANWPGQMVVYFCRYLFGRKLLNFRGFLITNAGSVQEF